MKLQWKTFGHAPAKSILERQLATGNPAHAYLFSGPEGLGKKMLALEFAGKILQTEKPLSHPDFLILDQAEEFSVEQIRDFIARLSLKPLAARKKVAIINNVHLLNVQSGNALLKTLEEPSASTVIILVGNGQRVLPTIRSRCLMLAMQQLSQGQLGEFAAANTLRVHRELLELCFGSPAQLVRLSQDAGYVKERQQQIARWQELKSFGVAERLLAIGQLAETENSELTELMTTWLLDAAQNLEQQPKTFTAVAALQEALAALGTNQNKKSILQSLFLKV